MVMGMILFSFLKLFPPVGILMAAANREKSIILFFGLDVCHFTTIVF